MTYYASLKNDYFGTYEDVPRTFNKEPELSTALDISFTEKQFTNIALAADDEETIDLGGLTSAKFIVIKCDYPIDVKVNSLGAFSCYPLCVLTANDDDADKFTALKITRKTTNTTNVYIRMV